MSFVVCLFLHFEVTCPSVWLLLLFFFFLSNSFFPPHFLRSTAPKTQSRVLNSKRPTHESRQAAPHLLTHQQARKASLAPLGPDKVQRMKERDAEDTVFEIGPHLKSSTGCYFSGSWCGHHTRCWLVAFFPPSLSTLHHKADRMCETEAAVSTCIYHLVSRIVKLRWGRMSLGGDKRERKEEGDLAEITVTLFHFTSLFPFLLVHFVSPLNCLFFCSPPPPDTQPQDITESTIWPWNLTIEPYSTVAQV